MPPPPLGPHDVSPAAPVPVAPHDAVLATPPPPAPHDAAEGHGPGLCNCCGATGECSLLPCYPNWPPYQIAVTLDGLEPPPSPCCNDVYTGFVFSFTYEVIYGDLSCINRTYSVPLVPTRWDFVHPCRWDFSWLCDIAITPDPHWQMEVSVMIFAAPEGVRFEATLYIGTRQFLHSTSNAACGFWSQYRTTIPYDTFSCDGPWVIPFGESGGILENGGWAGIPESITLYPSFGGTPPPAVSTDCCELTPDYDACKAFVCVGGATCEQVESGTGTYNNIGDCLDDPACGGGAHTFHCTGAPDYQCIDVGAGGEHATYELCASACLTSYDCTGDPVFECVDHGGPGGTYATQGECELACVPGGGDGRFECCPDTKAGGRPADQLDWSIVLTGADVCECLAQSGTAAWDPGDGASGAYVSGLPGVCGANMAVKIRCVGGAWYGEVWCNDAVIAVVGLGNITGDICVPPTSEFNPAIMNGGADIILSAANVCCTAAQGIGLTVTRRFPQ